MPILLLLLLLPLPLQGQADSSHREERDACRSAIAVVATGDLPPNELWALDAIPRCGAEGADALARAIRTHRGTSHVGFLSELTKPTQQLLDAQIYEAAFEVASDKRAAIEARIFALRTLIWTVQPGLRLTYENLAGDASGRRSCTGGGNDPEVEPSVGIPLHGNSDERLRQMAVRLTQDMTEPMALRQAALCARMVRPAS